jgi:hypothetical protein
MTVPKVSGTANSMLGTRTRSALWNASGENAVAVVDVVTLAR